MCCDIYVFTKLWYQSGYKFHLSTFGRGSSLYFICNLYEFVIKDLRKQTMDGWGKMYKYCTKNRIQIETRGHKVLFSNWERWYVHAWKTHQDVNLNIKSISMYNTQNDIVCLNPNSHAASKRTLQNILKLPSVFGYVLFVSDYPLFLVSIHFFLCLFC